MKCKLILILVALSFGLVSCDIGDDDNTQLLLRYVEVTSVDMPATLTFGEVNEIVVRYNNPTDCNSFYGFDVKSSLNERQVAVVTEYVDNGSCQESGVPTEETLKFIAASNGSYIFKFFTGTDASGNAEFLEYEVMVVN